MTYGELVCPRDLQVHEGGRSTYQVFYFASLSNLFLANRGLS